MRSRKPTPMSSNMVNRPSANPPGIVGAAIVPHAPQFLTLPETEDKAQVARVNVAMRAIGDKFRALDPDLLIVLSNAHCDDFVVHCVPAFAIHCGTRAEGSGGHHGPWPIDGEAGYALLRQLLDLGFDPAFTLDAKLGTAFTIPLDFCGYPRATPFLPIFVNAYVPPQATAPERSELARAIFAVVADAAAQAAFAEDRDRYAAGFELDADERAALVALDRDALRERFAINPMLLYQLEARVKA